mgnify:CR=1 FL=1
MAVPDFDPKDIGEDRSLLLVDDDEPFLRRLTRAMEKRGFEPEMAGSVAAGKAIATARPPAYAVVDLRLEDGNGLDVVETLREKRPESRIVVLTGYGAIATAVAAVTAFLSVKWLLRFIQVHTFVVFGWYRIALGLVLFLAWLDRQHSTPQTELL